MQKRENSDLNIYIYACGSRNLGFEYRIVCLASEKIQEDDCCECG
jgi:hypothetical protein